MKKYISSVILMLIICFTAFSVEFAYGQETVNPYNKKISAGHSNVATIKDDGTVWIWGSSNEGKLGNDIYVASEGLTINTVCYPVQAVDLTDVVSVSAGATHIMALKKDGTVWGWGHNYDGQVGNGNTDNIGKPVQAVGLTDVVDVSAGSYKTMAVKSDGTVWAWGENRQGDLVDGNTNLQLTAPVQVKGINDVISVSIGGNALALKKDGTVWGWGSNSTGGLGEDGGFASSKPVKIRGLSNIVAISAGGLFNAALRNDGTVWAWGENFAYELGSETIQGFSRTPVQIKGLTDVVAIDANFKNVIALKGDGTVWTWGSNEYGQLGNNSTVYKSAVPVYVSALNDIVSVSAGVNYFIAADKNGDVFSWGYNYFCQLGNGSGLNSSVPTEALMKMGPQEDAVRPPLYITPAKPTNSNVMVNGTKISFEAYNINYNNYFKLRDIAMSLDGSNKQFNVEWNDKLSSIEITTDKSYSPAGGELAVTGDTADKTASLTGSKIYLNGEQISLTAYNINGNNYFKLRDLSKYIDFGVGWDGTTNTISLDTSKGYVE